MELTPTFNLYLIIKIKVMLWKVVNHYGDGKVTDDIIYSESPIVISPEKDNIKSSMARRFMYEVEYPYHPTLHVNDDGKKYIVPMWMEVHPQTTFNDIKWIKPKEKKVIEKVQGSMGEYKTTYDPNKNTYKCNCLGFWRSKENCKHVKALREKSLATKNK
jgi:hypothetical protein